MVESVAIHRCRFVDHTPSAITSLAFPPLPLPSVKGKAKYTPEKPLRFGTLAVGRANGNIDLAEWSGSERENESAQAWVVRKTLPGPYPSKVDSLAFVIRYPDDLEPHRVPSCSDLRLFSSGGGSDLVEWDIERGCIQRTISSQGGSIWSIAVNPSSTTLALGCEDGSVRLLSLANDTLTHHRRFDRVKCRLLSIAWGPPLPLVNKKEGNSGSSDDDSDDDDDEWGDSWLVTGGSDSSLRKWDVSTGRVIDKMGTDKVKGERTLVWTVGVLGDGTIVSGDSLGTVKFWDSLTCTQLQTFKGHEADVLCLAIGPEGTTVYTSGVDQKVSQFSLIKNSNQKSAVPRPSGRWIKNRSRWMHSHDVRALATWPPYSVLPPSHKRQFPIDIAPILASGGLDMSVILTPVALPSSTVVKITNPLSTSVASTFEDSYQRRMAYTSGPSSTCAVRLARQARLVTCMRDTGLSVWRILRKQVLSEAELALNQTDHKGWERVVDMELNVRTNLVASAISDNGRWLVISDLYETRLFMIEHDAEGGLNPKRIRNFSSILQAHLPHSPSSTGGLAFSFTPDSSKLVMSTALSTQVLIIDLGINTEDQEPRVLRRFDHHRMRDGIIGGRVIKGIKAGDDVAMGRTSGDEDDEDEMDSAGPVVASILRIAISADGQWLATSDDLARTHVFNLDSVQHHCVLPSFPQPAQTLSFDPSRPNLLILGFPDNTLQMFNVETRLFPAWSKLLCNALPESLTEAHDPILGVTFDPSSLSSTAPKYALFWGSTWLFKVPLQELAVETNKKRRRKLAAPPSAETPPEFKKFTQYRPILLVDFLEAGEMVVVERPLVDVLANLPPAFFKPKYGTS